jgi:hypothetical protein
MAGMVAELESTLSREDKAAQITHLWDTYSWQRREKLEEVKELRNYLFATDTTKTTNRSLPWRNSTTRPKLCNIRDNLHSNYLSALFPNKDWLVFEPATQDDAVIQKARSVEAYMRNKTDNGDFKTTVSRLLLDFIDYGNAFCTVNYVNDVTVLEDNSTVADYVGPVLQRISPLDIVFNNAAPSFKESFKIIRTITTIGEIKELAAKQPENEHLKRAIEKHDTLTKMTHIYGVEDWDKQESYEIEGFGSLHEYYQNGSVELLEFWGDYHDPISGELYRNQVITVMDRSSVIREDFIPTWLGHPPIYHVGWRLRPDNLYAMGPLDNLVGIQYRIDHLENAKADAMDLAILPPLVIQGEVERFEYGPRAEIHIDEAGGVTELGKNLNAVITAENEIQVLEQEMEIMAGAPREAMGIRTPGEKTAFEVGQLNAAAGRIFQEKIQMFETELLEKALNAMWAYSRQFASGVDNIRVFDDLVQAEIFMSVTREDITASGKIKPRGAQHFASQQQLMQNLNGLFNSAVGQIIAPHVSAKSLARLVEQSLGLYRADIVKENAAIKEQADMQRVANQVQEDLMVEAEQEIPEGV